MSKLYIELKELVKDIYLHTSIISQENEILKISLNNNKNFVYVVDVENDEILYINDVLEKVVGDVVGKKCYETLQDSLAKCDFCTFNKLTLDKPYTWVHYNEKLNKVFYIIDVLKNINNRLVKLEKATDITDQLLNLEIIINKIKYDKGAI
jgi:hypothetical protein